MTILNESIFFPDVALANKDGLLAMGGDLSVERLLLAYKNGIFPWYNENEAICWWSPNPRFVLFTKEVKISKSMHSVLNNSTLKFTINKAFEEVINNCKNINRKGQDGTWLQNEVVDAYIKLYKLGFAISAETWKNGELVGGLYGVKLGNIFFGESMFSKVNNASKFCFINFVKFLQKNNVELIDCQIYTSHLESLGAKMIDRKYFGELLKQYIT